MQLKKNIFDFLHFANVNPEQKETLAAMQAFVSPSNEEDFLILSGAAGTGKTSITSALVGYLGHIEKPYRLAAPTGRAARIIGRKSNCTSNTLHSLIYDVSTNKSTGAVNFQLKDWSSIKPVVFIIDEASMIPKNQDTENVLFTANRGLIFDLIEFIKKGNPKNKVVFIGDEYQLEPIKEKESAALNKQFLEESFKLSGSIQKLRKVHRQDDGSYILTNATRIRTAIDEHQTSCPINSIKENRIYGAAKNFTKKLNDEGYESTISIACSHKSNKFFNDLVRKERFGYSTKAIEVNDILLVTQNWTRNEQKLYNGDQVEVLFIDWDKVEQVAGLHFAPIRVRPLFSDEEIEDYLLLDCFKQANGTIPSDKENIFRQFRYTKNPIYRESGIPSDDKYVGAMRLMFGYAITCNKAQGGEWDNVFLNEIYMPSLRWKYTAVTRAKRQLHTF